VVNQEPTLDKFFRQDFHVAMKQRKQPETGQEDQKPLGSLEDRNQSSQEGLARRPALPESVSWIVWRFVEIEIVSNRIWLQIWDRSARHRGPVLARATCYRQLVSFRTHFRGRRLEVIDLVTWLRGALGAPGVIGGFT
jgi:hypothetical protein